MNSKKIFIFLVLINCVLIKIHSQEIRGHVVSTEKTPIPYSSVYLQNEKVGIMTDSAGLFSLPNNILNSNHLDTVIVSSIGYVTKKMPCR